MASEEAPEVKKLTPAELKKAFDLFDADGSGTLNKTELMGILTRAGGAAMTEADAEEVIELYAAATTTATTRVRARHATDVDHSPLCQVRRERRRRALAGGACRGVGLDVGWR